MPLTPSPPPPKLREICLLCLFAQQSYRDQDPSFCQMLAKELKVSTSWITAGWERATALQAHLKLVDQLIDQTTKGYDPERLGAVERAVLRLGISEMLFDATIPAKVAISEAMRLVRKFSNKKSATLINAVMDTLHGQKDENSAT